MASKKKQKNNSTIPIILEKGEEDQSEMKLNVSPAAASHLTNNYLDEVRQVDMSKKKTSLDMSNIIKFIGSFFALAALTGLAVKFYFFPNKKEIKNVIEK